jgi:hypothetical protein
MSPVIFVEENVQVERLRVGQIILALPSFNDAHSFTRLSLLTERHLDVLLHVKHQLGMYFLFLTILRLSQLRSCCRATNNFVCFLLFVQALSDHH